MFTTNPGHWALLGRRVVYSALLISFIAPPPEVFLSVTPGDTFNAQVNALAPLQAGDYVLVAASPTGNNGIYLDKVLASYAKGGGKYGKYNAVIDSKSNILAFSNIAVQLFEQSCDRAFKSITEVAALLGPVLYALLPSI
ncbi:hypothetical protein F5879DRAFT_996278 [Lentinula edodes]|nr:hypothetical protein F5879DRAFT_996278 [Lentinula edodes]